jgi:DNA topoisomerase-1
VRDETKYERMIAFGRALPVIRERTERDLGRAGLPREKVLAAVVRLLETTLIRVGNDEYARHNRSFGLTTMRDRHVDVDGGTIRFHFRGKSGKRHSLELHDPRLARIVRRCQELPGQELFAYVDEKGETQPVGSADVNEYLRDATGEDFTSKDFRTWHASAMAAGALRRLGPAKTEREAKRKVKRAMEMVAAALGNTATVCRTSYVHPATIESFLDGSLFRLRVSRERDLDADERLLLAVLRRRERAERAAA